MFDRLHIGRAGGKKRSARSAMIVGLLCFGLSPHTAHAADEIQNIQFKVLGTWSSLNNFNAYEKPLWTEHLPEATDDAVSGRIISMSEMGLKGSETMRLLKQGIFDAVHLTMGYAVGDEPAMEGLDLAALTRGIEKAQKVADAYLPQLNERMRADHDLKILSAYPFTSQAFYCNEPIDGLSDLEGLKVRTYSAALADFVEGAGATNVNVPFGEVIQALEKGVVDCAITGTMPGYAANWHEVATHLYTLRVGWGIVTLTVSLDTWERLNEPTRAAIEDEVAAFDKRVWAGVAELDQQGINCNTGAGPCKHGEAGDMTWVQPTEAELAKRTQIVQDHVLAGFKKRCDSACTEMWNQTAGEVAGVKIER